jgi:hypothetical protein
MQHDRLNEHNASACFTRATPSIPPVTFRPLSTHAPPVRLTFDLISQTPVSNAEGRIPEGSRQTFQNRIIQPEAPVPPRTTGFLWSVTLHLFSNP